MILSLKKYVIAAVLALTATAAYASCVTNTVVGPRGQMVICITCCYSPGNCTTTCM